MLFDRLDRTTPQIPIPSVRTFGIIVNQPGIEVLFMIFYNLSEFPAINA